MPSPMTNEANLPPRSPLRGRARALTLEIAAEARAEWGFATDIIARAFRAHRELGSGDRRLISETVYGLIRWDRRLDAIVDELAAGAGETLSVLARDELLLIAHEAQLAGRRRGGDGPRRAELGRLARLKAAARENLAARLCAPDAGLGASRGIDREAVRLSYPTWLLERLVNDLGRTRRSRWPRR